MSNVIHPEYLKDFETLLSTTGNSNDSESIEMIVSKLKKHDPGAIMLLMEYPAANNPTVVETIVEILRLKDNFGRLTFDQLLHFKDIEQTVYAQILIENLINYPECAVMAYCLPISSITEMMVEINKVFDENIELRNIAIAAKDFEPIDEYVVPTAPPEPPGPGLILHE